MGDIAALCEGQLRKEEHGMARILVVDDEKVMVKGIRF